MATFIIICVIVLVICEAKDKHGDLKAWAEQLKKVEE
jgi:hypothetical protein